MNRAVTIVIIAIAAVFLFGRPLYMVMILVVLGTYAIFIGLTFFDYGYR